MSPIDISQPMLWAALGCSQYESQWMAFHRFLWMNSLNANSLWRMMIGATRLDSSIPYKTSFKNIYLRTLSEFQPAEEFFSHFKIRSFENIFGNKNSEIISSTRSVRYCPDCLKNCFHSPYFQFGTLQECPQHHLPLVMGCTKCGMPLGNPEFDPADFIVPMCCPHCKKSFSRSPFAKKLLLSNKSEAHLFERLEINMFGIKYINFKEEHSILGEPWSPKDYEKICQAIAGLAINKSYLNSGGLCVSERWKEYKCMDSQDYVEDSQSWPLSKEIIPFVAIAKSINRYFKKNILKICGHKNSQIFNWQSAYRPFCHPEGVLSAEVYQCPCCALMAQWRAYSGKVIAIRNVLKGRREGYVVSGNFRKQYSLEPNVFAESLISSFTWFVHSFCTHIKYLTGKKTEHWFYSDKESIECRIPVNMVIFDTYRFEIDMFGYILKKENGEEICLTISLQSAFQELNNYFHEIYEKDFKSLRYSRPLSKDEWSLSLSEHFVRLDSRKWSYVPGRILFKK